MNYFKTFVLVAMLTGFFVSVGYMAGGKQGMIMAFVIAASMNFLAYWNSDSMVLKMSGAILANPNEYPNYYKIVEKLISNTSLPMPKLYVVDQEIPNAFATGRNPQNSAVGVTSGLLSLLSEEELSGVIAHELAHIENRDTLISTITATFAGAISMIGTMFMFSSMFGGRDSNRGGLLGSIIFMIIAPMVAMLIQMAISRTREYAADKRGGEICGNPIYLASALKKLEEYSQLVRNNRELQENKATAHMYIVNHFADKADNVFSTHPSTANRVTDLERQAAELGVFSYPNFTKKNPYDNVSKEKSVINGKKSDSHIANNPWK